jgi:hypothetical protein
MHDGLILVELNEVNFDYVRRYCAEGNLPTLSKLIADHGVIETTSESHYVELEPWIQWVTAHTGLSFAEHGIFRLGDITNRNVIQIWEALEAAGKTVGAISPMNAVNRCASPAFFVPDPWTQGPVIGSTLVRKLYGAVAQAVNENAQARVSPKSAFWLLVGLARFAQPCHYGRYARLLTNALRGRSWSKALLLDQLLTDIFLDLLDTENPDFSTIFLNAAAHIQHHFMFNSRAYDGVIHNPGWYINARDDPLFEVYDHYDRIIAEVQRRHPHKRLMIATGLHQDPHPKTTFYWRLRDHAEFLQRHGIGFSSVEPRMSRDFLIRCACTESARAAERALNSMVSEDGSALFEVDNRGDNLFVMLIWPSDISNDFVFFANRVPQHGLRADVVFVAFKNGQHNGIGYLIDGGHTALGSISMPLARLPSVICEAFNLDWQALQTNASLGSITT